MRSEKPSPRTSSVCGLRQILLNLVGNAVKFTAHGTVMVCVDLVSMDSDCVRLHFRVADTGIGIPAERLETIFSPFCSGR